MELCVRCNINKVKYLKRKLCSSCYGKVTYLEKYKFTKKNPEPRTKQKTKDINLKRKFGISLDEFNKMVKEQDNKCSICKREEKVIDHIQKTIRALAVDHCHETGKVRGLLCTKCNLALGCFEDNLSIMLEACNYIVRSKTKP